ncbi:MAG: hypothetical protein RMK74_07420, partial [Myxococcales bacterium]|nr:hypothetical protein [Myxococcales bacterium]
VIAASGILLGMFAEPLAQACIDAGLMPESAREELVAAFRLTGAVMAGAVTGGVAGAVLAGGAVALQMAAPQIQEGLVALGMDEGWAAGVTT